MAYKRLVMVVLAAFAAGVLSACNTTPVQDGVVAGGLLGSAAGAIIGHQSGRQGEGALIGAGVGALTGALIGDDIGRRQRYHAPAPTAYYAPAPTYAPAPAYAPPAATHATRGYYETRLVRAPSGETYEERVFVPLR